MLIVAEFSAILKFFYHINNENFADQKIKNSTDNCPIIAKKTIVIIVKFYKWIFKF